jgi:hypothetical protein
MSKFVRKFSLVLCGERIDDFYMKELCVKYVSYSVVYEVHSQGHGTLPALLFGLWSLTCFISSYLMLACTKRTWFHCCFSLVIFLHGCARDFRCCNLLCCDVLRPVKFVVPAKPIKIKAPGYLPCYPYLLRPAHLSDPVPSFLTIPQTPSSTWPPRNARQDDDLVARFHTWNGGPGPKRDTLRGTRFEG